MMTAPETRKVLAISGSTRSHSTNRSILQAVAALYVDVLDVEIYNDIARLPHFNPDLDVEEVDPAVSDFRKRVEVADGVLFCTPEYVFSLPGTLKNAIDWVVSTTVFSDKPVGLIVASGLGEKAFQSLITIMRAIGATFDDQATLLISGARKRFNADGTLTEETCQELRVVVDSMIAAMERQKK